MYLAKIAGGINIGKFFQSVEVSMGNAKLKLNFLQKYFSSDTIQIYNLESIIERFQECLSTKDFVLKFSSEIDVDALFMVDVVTFEKSIDEKLTS